MRNPDDAADALQDAYISAFRRAETFRGDAAVTTWLHRIVVNACLDRLRRARSRPSETAAGRTRTGSRELATATGRAIRSRRKEQQSVVAAALATLNPDQRAALVLVDMEGYSVEEAARNARLRGRHGEEPLRPRPGEAAAAARPLRDPERVTDVPPTVRARTRARLAPPPAHHGRHGTVGTPTEQDGR